MSKRISCSGR